MTENPDPFDILLAAHERGGVDAVLAELADLLRTRRRHHELFEVLKMQVRRRLGLPLLYHDLGDELSPELRDQLEEGLIEACREVGLLLLAEGRIREGWMYMRPVGDRSAVARRLQELAITEDNLEEVLDVALRDGVDTTLGFALVLEHYGTCNAITTFDTELVRRSPAEQQAAAGLLVEHLHRELVEAVRTDIARQEGSSPAEANLAELLADRDWLLGEGAYHIDTTHLAATVRVARLLDDPAQLRLALDLTEYGRRLASTFQHPGEEPFVDMYPASALYFQALLGEEAAAAVDYFRQQAEQAEPSPYGSPAIETYIALLARIGRHAEAIAASVDLLPAQGQMLGIAPSLLELSHQAGDYGPLLAHCRQRDDLLGFAAALVKARGDEPAAAERES